MSATLLFFHLRNPELYHFVSFSI